MNWFDLGLLANGESSPGLLTYFFQSNVAGQVIVVVLVFFSVLAWSAMLGKRLQLKRMHEANRRFEQYINQLDSVVGVEDPSPYIGRGPFSDLFALAVNAYHQTDYSGSGGASVGHARIGLVENALQRGVAQKTHVYEDKMILLASIVSGAPFLGLLGTAWGVMDAFGAVAMKSSVTLQMLAPGVSGSLLTTVAALVVAIPSAFGYNYLLSRVKLNTTELENFASFLADRFELEHKLVN
jgi:biopolymer transport protein TolQ